MIPFAVIPLFGAGGDVVEFILAMIIVIFIGIGKMLSAIQEAKETAQRKERARRAAEKGDAAKKKSAAAASSSGDEVEAFLERAKQRKMRRRTTHATNQAAAAPVVAEAVLEKSPLEPVGGQVAAHVQQYLDDEDFRRRESKLGSEVTVVDREVEQHVHQVFDHQLSKLAAAPGETSVEPAAVEPTELATDAASTAPPELADVTPDVFELLHSPDLIGQAIVLNEILHRPEERWG